MAMAANPDLVFPLVGRDTGVSDAVRAGDTSRAGDYPSTDRQRPARHRVDQEAQAVTAMMQQTLGVPRVDHYLRDVAGVVARALPSDVLVTFELLGPGGGVWTLHTADDGVRVSEGRALWADSVLTCTLPRFVDLVKGQVDVQQAFFDGTVQVEGDVGLLLRLHKALPEAV